MNRAEFAECVGLLSASVGRDMQKSQAEAWFLLLQDLTGDELRAGIAGALQAHMYAGFPPIGLIRQHARPETPKLLDSESAAISAWTAVLGAITKIGVYSGVDFGPLVNATIRSLGGWQRLGDTSLEDLARFVRPQFLQSFRAFMSTGVREREGAALRGIFQEQVVRVDLQLPLSPPKMLPSLGSQVVERTGLRLPQAIEG